MHHKVRVNLANSDELLELPFIRPEQAQAILEFRAQHGPIKDAGQLAKVLHSGPLAESTRQRVDFAPADTTAPEAPGA